MADIPQLQLLVPRAEVEAALRAVVDEFTSIKVKMVDQDHLDSILQQKADKSDVQRSRVTLMSKRLIHLTFATG